MNSYRTRRATVDDLVQLSELWQAAKLPAQELEKQLTEFQIAETEDGKLVGAIGLRIVGSNGKIHSEAFEDFSLSDTLRPALWERLLVVAKNHGLFRVWTEESAPWWKKDAGFTTPSEELLQKLPEAFGSRNAAWLALRLKDEGADPALLDKEISMFREAEKREREKIIYRAKVIRVLGTLISALIFVFAMCVLFYVMRHRRQ